MGVPNIIEDLENLKTFQSNIFNTIYPVGSIYISVNSVNPANIFGGTWEQIQGRFLLGANSNYVAGSTGGEVTHTLTVNEMPSHTHNLKTSQNASMFNADSSGGAWVYDNQFMLAAKRNIGGTTGIDNIVNTSNLLTGEPIALTGGGAAHNNMPPYLTVYMWKRIN